MDVSAKAVSTPFEATELMAIQGSCHQPSWAMGTDTTEKAFQGGYDDEPISQDGPFVGGCQLARVSEDDESRLWLIWSEAQPHYPELINRFLAPRYREVPSTPAVDRDLAGQGGQETGE